MGSLLKETCSLCLAFPRFIIIIYLPDLRDQVHLVRIADSVKSPVNWQFQDLFQLTDHIATKLIIPWIMLSVQRWNTPFLDQLSDHSSMFVLPRYIDRPTKNEPTDQARVPSKSIFSAVQILCSPMLNLHILCCQHFSYSGDPTGHSSGLSEHVSGNFSFNWALFGANLSVIMSGLLSLVQYHTNSQYGKSFKIEFPQNSY